MSRKRLLLTTSVLALGLSGAAFAQTGAGSSAGAGSMGTTSGSPSYTSPSTGGSAGNSGSTGGGSSGSSMNRSDMNGSGANGGPMASGTSGSRSSSSMSNSSSDMSSSGAGRVSSDEIRQAQEALQDQGLYHGQVDGKWGPQTKNAIAQFQKQKGLKQTAQLDQQTMNDLQSSSGGSSGSMSNAPSSRSPSSSSGAGMSGGGTSGMTRGNGASTAPGNAGGANSSSMPAR
jgi:hypothetical protein